jgi:hypothetical protein
LSLKSPEVKSSGWNSTCSRMGMRHTRETGSGSVRSRSRTTSGTTLSDLPRSGRRVTTRGTSPTTTLEATASGLSRTTSSRTLSRHPARSLFVPPSSCPEVARYRRKCDSSSRSALAIHGRFAGPQPRVR